jgi:hypothetical protein
MGMSIAAVFFDCMIDGVIITGGANPLLEAA